MVDAQSERISARLQSATVAAGQAKARVDLKRWTSRAQARVVVLHRL